jgi:hypothetical protein
MALGGQGAGPGPGMPGEPGLPLEVVGLPPADLIKQVRFGSPVQSCRGQQCVLELCVLAAAEGALGQEPLAQPLQGQRVGPVCPAPVQRVRGDMEE